MPSLPTGTVTFLFTDIEGSTVLLQRLGDRRYAEVLAEHRRLLSEAFDEGHGQVVDTQGDAFLVAFSRARDALGTAVAAQRVLTRHSWPDGASLRVRMGLHTGEPVTEIGGYVGLDLHRAARICAAGHGGQILLSDSVSGLAARDLPPGVTLRDLGTHRLKDLQQPERLLQVVHPDLPGDFPPLKSLDARPNNLPRQLTSFVGREKEMAEVKRLLSTAYLVTLTGSGGAGKTRLALQVAADVVDGYPGGVWLAEFAPIADPVLVPKTVASALSVPEQPGREMTDTLADALRPKALLLVLDNCEHLLAACRDLAATLLRRCPQVRILATSREGLGVPGETVWRVPSLSAPEDIHNLPPSEQLVLYDAVRLFVDRAVATTPAFSVTSENAAAVAQLCQRLDGIPLAIELAAARVKVLAVDQIAARLDDRFRLLTGGSRTLPPRQQTLRATLDWSYDLLSDQERAVLRRLSVFAGGWTLEAVETVCAGDGVEASDILDILAQLVDKSLVTAETHGGEARYRMLETVRQYGVEKLQGAGESTGVRRRHRDWFLALAEQAEPELRGPDQVAWSTRLDREYDNLRVALDWSKIEGGTLEAGLRLAGSLYLFWEVRGLNEVNERLEDMLAQGKDTSPAVRAKGLKAAVFLAHRRGDYERLSALSNEALTLFRALGDDAGSAFALHYLAHVKESQGNFAQAAEAMEDSVALCRRAGDTWWLYVTMNCQGEIVRLQGDYERAAALSEESLRLARAQGDTRGVAASLVNLGVVVGLQGQYGRSEALLKEGLGLYWQLGYKWRTSYCLLELARTASGLGRFERGARLFGIVATLQRITGVGPRPSHLTEDDPAMITLRDSLGDAAFAAAWAEGRAMTLEQAIEYALASEEPRVQSDTAG